MSASFHNMHVPLSTDIHTRLKAEAKRSGQPATVLVREAIETWLVERERPHCTRLSPATPRRLPGQPPTWTRIWKTPQSNSCSTLNETGFCETRRSQPGAVKAALRLGTERPTAGDRRLPDGFNRAGWRSVIVVPRQPLSHNSSPTAVALPDGRANRVSHQVTRGKLFRPTSYGRGGRRQGRVVSRAALQTEALDRRVRCLANRPPFQ